MYIVLAVKTACMVVLISELPKVSVQHLILTCAHPHLQRAITFLSLGRKKSAMWAGSWLFPVMLQPVVSVSTSSIFICPNSFQCRCFLSLQIKFSMSSVFPWLETLKTLGPVICFIHFTYVGLNEIKQARFRFKSLVNWGISRRLKTV